MDRLTLVERLCRWTGCALLLGMAASTHADEPAIRNNAPSAVRSLQVQAVPDQTLFVSPLERLRARSAEQRLEELRRSWRESEANLRRTAAEFRTVDSTVQTIAGERQDGQVSPIPTYSETYEVVDEPASNYFARLVQAAEAEGSLYQPPVRDPAELKKLTEIIPFYEPPPPGRMPEDVLEMDEKTMKEVPQYVHLSSGPYIEREPAHESKPWLASDLFHQPLYFQDEGLERYGHVVNWPWLQPVVSVGKFSGQLVTLPYQMTLNPINERMYVLGHYSPGDFVPYKMNKIPWNKRALFNQSAVTTGLIFLIP